MEQKSFIDDKLQAYVEAVSLREPPVLQRLREETARHPRSIMLLPAEQGQLLGLLVQATGAKRCLEIGVFTGYSSTAVALALPPDGRITACDVSEEFTSVARRYWAEAGVADKIDLRIAPAVQTLESLAAQGEQFDFVFIDADKPNYARYFDLVLPMLRRGGLIVMDNVLQRGRVLDLTQQDDNVRAMRDLNQKLHADERVTISLLPIGDGLMLAVKR